MYVHKQLGQPVFATAKEKAEEEAEEAKVEKEIQNPKY